MAANKFHFAIRKAAFVAGLISSLAAATPTIADDASRVVSATPRTERIVTVENATITWHLTPKASVKRTELVTMYRKATSARLNGGAPVVTRRSRPERTSTGRAMLRLPVELMPTMFAGADGRTFCDDSTMTSNKASETSSKGEVQ